MAITSGFGFVLDINNGTIRHWFLGKDGIKHWVDNNEPVNESAVLPGSSSICGDTTND